MNDILDYEYNYKRLLEGKRIIFNNEKEEVTPEQTALFEVIAEINKNANSWDVGNMSESTGYTKLHLKLTP